MKKNIPEKEKLMRYFVGLFLLLAGHLLGEVAKDAYALNLVALITLTTGYFEYCPIYALLEKINKRGQ